MEKNMKYKSAKIITALSLIFILWLFNAFIFVFYARVSYPVNISVEGISRKDTDAISVYCVTPKDLVFKIGRNFQIHGSQWTINNYVKNIRLSFKRPWLEKIGAITVEINGEIYSIPKDGIFKKCRSVKSDEWKNAVSGTTFSTGGDVVTLEIIPDEIVSSKTNIPSFFGIDYKIINWPGFHDILFKSLLFTVFPLIILGLSFRLQEVKGEKKLFIHIAFLFMASYIFYGHFAPAARFFFTFPAFLKNLLYTVFPCVIFLLFFSGARRSFNKNIIHVASLLFLCCFFIYGQHSLFIRTFDVCSDKMVKNSVYLAVDRGIFHKGGFMIVYDREDLVYTPQFALQYKIIAAAAPSDKKNLSGYFHLCETASAALLAILFSIFIVKTQREFGRLVSISAFVLLLFSPWPAALATNLYWAAFTIFAPFVFSWCCYEESSKSGRASIFYSVICALVAMKSLCGYEYLTNITLGATVPVLYYELKNNSGIKSAFSKMAKTFVSGCAGFFIAFSLHLWQGVNYFGSLKAAVLAATNSAAARTVGDVYGNYFSLADDASIFIKYLFQPATLFFSHIALIIAIIIFF
ncbi:MAG TPA: hypothetical protein PKK26_05705, partial [Candidatus Wallbacteria bacterium]|nr:hypothetical protein [Candidatus Wallbacteria bacterium]